MLDSRIAGYEGKVRVPRVFCQQELFVNSEIMLSAQSSQHVAAVLRLSVGAPIVLFNGMGGEFAAEIVAVEKRQVVAKPLQFVARDVESPLKIHLGQAISRGDKMDLTIQKAVELGVVSITPLFTERCGVKLTRERLQKRLEHWQAVVISACEQSGRNTIPQVMTAIVLPDWLEKEPLGLLLVLDHRASQDLSVITQVPQEVTILVGSEGGLSLDELELAQKRGFVPLNLGSRVLRTETAALAAISALQVVWGDFKS